VTAGRGGSISEAASARRASRDIYCYFDNDMKVKASFDARRLIERLGLRLDLPAPGRMFDEDQ